jgi:hypothetical protein
MEAGSMSSQSPLREIWDDLRTEARQRRAQLLAALTYVVLGAGGLYLYSSTGPDSDDWYDSVDRTTLAGVGIGLLTLGVLIGALTLRVDRSLQRSTTPGSAARPLRRARLVAAMASGGVLVVAGVVAIRVWYPADATLPLDEVAKAACGNDYDIRDAGDRAPLTREGADCASAQVALFDGPHARDGYVEAVAESGPVLVGTNWAISANESVLKDAQAAIGGRIEGQRESAVP